MPHRSGLLARFLAKDAEAEEMAEAVLRADRVIVMSHGPGARVAEDLRVPAPRPRTGESMRSSEMQDLAAQLREILMTKKAA